MISETMQYEKKFASIAGKQIAYVEEGSGDPIVLLHGNQLRLFYGVILFLSLQI